jgi:cephalosporin-C deacetylase-like acetyl esterase
LTGYIKGRAGGWPPIFGTKDTQLPERIETSRYYDVVNFARLIKVPGWYSWGYNDNICPPTSIFSAYNVITAPKEKHIFLDAQHWYYPEQLEQRKNWINEQLMTHTY